jgi:hypothetical protein
MNLLQTNPTQAVGLIVFAASALACFCAWKVRRRETWAVLAGVHALLWTEVLLGLRHELHDLVNAWLRSLDAYQARAPAQALLVAMAVAVLAWLACRSRRNGVAVVATALLGVLFLIETISLHQLDRVLYAQPGPLKLIAYAWIALAAAVVGAALRARR